MKKYAVLSFFSLVFYTIAIAQNVGIGTTMPNASAQLDISSNSKGMLIPRMTDAEKNAIVAPVQGLMVFNITTNSFQYFNGVSWSNMAHSGIINGTPNKIAKFNSPWGVTPGMMTDNGTGVGINTTSTLAHASSVLDLTSTNKGVLIPRMTTIQKNAIASPVKGLMVFDSTANNFSFYDGTAWTDLNGGGSSNWTVLGNNIYNSNTGNVGIGASTPFEKLTVDGNIVTSGGIGIGSATPNLSSYKLDVNGDVRTIGSMTVGGTVFTGYKFSVIDGSIAVYNTTDSKTWTMNYNSSSNTLNFNEGGTTPRLSILNGGLVGIGTTTPGYQLDVDGTIKAGNNLRADGSLIVQGSATINGGGGVAYNPNSSTNLKIVPFTTANFHAVLGPHGSAETTIALPGGFSGTPRVFVGSIAVTGGVSGELNRVILQLWNCDNNSCTAKIINTDNTAVDYNITWNCLAIGN
jgi:hypothetical protein